MTNYWKRFLGPILLCLIMIVIISPALAEVIGLDLKGGIAIGGGVHQNDELGLVDMLGDGLPALTAAQGDLQLCSGLLCGPQFDHAPARQQVFLPVVVKVGP